MEPTDFERLVERLRTEFFSRLTHVEARMELLATQVATNTTQIMQHIAVCDERQKGIEKRSGDRERWETERTDEWRRFMRESMADRQKIREMVQSVGWRILISVVATTITSGLAFALYIHFASGVH